MELATCGVMACDLRMGELGKTTVYSDLDEADVGGAIEVDDNDVGNMG